MKTMKPKFINKTLQLNEFLETFENTDKCTHDITYSLSANVFFVSFFTQINLTRYVLVTQKNQLRSFSNINTLINTIGLETDVIYKFDLED